MDDELSAESIRRGLQTDFVGRNVLFFKSIDSTNTVARDMARLNAAEGTLVIADRQIGGRGRLGRRWLAPPGTALLMSLVFRPDLAPQQIGRLTMLCSLGVADAVEAVTGLSPRIKWPNDLLIGSRKLAGVLTELGARGNRVDFVVVGIGLNVNVSEEDFRSLQDFEGPSPTALQDLADHATSLLRELGRPVRRLDVLQRSLLFVERRYEALRSGRSPAEEWRARLDTLGREVTVTQGDESIAGRAEDVDDDGALLLRLADGRLERILAGDVTLRPPVRRFDN